MENKRDRQERVKAVPERIYKCSCVVVVTATLHEINTVSSVKNCVGEGSKLCYAVQNPDEQ